MFGDLNYFPYLCIQIIRFMNMRKLLLLFVGLIAALAIHSESITEKQALQKARQFMKGKNFLVESNARGRDDASPQQSYYVFNAEGNDGFVIVAGDDRMPEVLGYSDTGSLDVASAPSNVKWLLNYYEQTVKYLQRTGTVLKRVRRAAKPEIRPLVSTTWGQSSPYNDLCPKLYGQNCVTGCVATAMAQVVNYHRWPKDMTGRVDDYVSATNSLIVPMLEPTMFDWDNMTNEDIARLMLYCGQAVKMDYGVDESGAMPPDEAGALIKVFGFSQTAHYVEDANYSAEDWEDLLYNELAEQRPIVYNGWGTGGGHTFVVHGYADGRFYINWGWNGNEDGYFVLTGLNTGIGDVNSTQSATIGIQPPGGSDTSRPSVVVKGMQYGGSKFTFRNSGNSFPAIQASGTLVSDASEAKALGIGLGLYDNAGLKQVLWESQHTFSMDEEYQFEASLTIGSDVANGEYRIVPISRKTASDDWQADANASDYYLKATVSSKYLKVVSCPMDAEERNTTDIDVQTIDGITYHIYSQSGKNRATVLPSENGKYKGNIFIPDFIGYEGTDYKVYKADFQAFQNCDELISLSAAMTEWPYVSSCQNLEKVELREGVSQLKDPIENCAKLQSVTFPKSLSTLKDGVGSCEGIKELRFLNTDLIQFEFFPNFGNGSLPSLTDIYFMVEESPSFRWTVGEFIIHPSVTIHVPKGAKPAYEASEWKGWKVVDDQAVRESTGIEWGYCDGNKVTDNIVYDQVGDNDAEYAIRVPAEMLEAYRGKTISAIQYFQAANAYDYVFVTKPHTDYLVKQPSGVDQTKSWVTVELPEKYVITGEDLYVGVGRHDLIEMTFSDIEATAPDGFWFRWMGAEGNYGGADSGEWVNIGEKDANFCHPIPLRFIIMGDELPNDILLKNVALKAGENGKYTISAKVQNRTLKTVKEYTLSWDFDGKEKGSKTMTTSLAANHSESISFDVVTSLTDRNHDFHYAITDIDGSADAVSANSTGVINFNAPAHTYYPRRVVMEEATGTWCGSCVHGTETIDRLTKEYPDNFIAISLHANDEMDEIENYNAITNKFMSYPSSLVNRIESVNPLYPKVLPLVNELKDKAEAKVTASAVFAKPDSSAVTVSTESMFGFSQEQAADFRLAYVVLEDRVGPYEQSNSYSGTPSFTEDAEYMKEWGEKPAKILMEHNNVARGIYGGVNGKEGSLPTIIKEGEAYQYEYSFVLPDNIQNKGNIRIVVLLIENKTGEIINACQTAVAYDKKVDEMVFDFTDSGKELFNGESVSYFAKLQGENAVCGTNLGNEGDGLVMRTFSGKQVEGTAKLEIVGSTLTAGNISWAMGGTPESLAGKTVLEKTFTTDAEGRLPVLLTAENLTGYGRLSAILTVIVGGQTQTLNVNLEYGKLVVNSYSSKEDEIWWNNHGETNGRIGSEMVDRYHVATHIPFGLLGSEGTTINGFGFIHDVISQENVTVWISTKLPENGDDADLEVVKVPNEQLINPLESYWNHVAFEHKYEIPEEGLYVGCSFDISKLSVENGWCPVQHSGKESGRKGALWIKTDRRNPKWSDVGTVYGNLACQVLFGGNLKKDSVRLSNASLAFGTVGGKAKVRCELVNEGAFEVNNLTFLVKDQMGMSNEVDVDVAIPLFSKGVFSIDVDAEKQEGVTERTITVKRVNGRPNRAIENASAGCKLYTMACSPAIVPVLEYVTDTGSGEVPNILAFSKLKEQLDDRVIFVEAHKYGVMYLPEYQDVFDLAPNWMNVYYINRERNRYIPYYGSSGEKFGVIKDMQEALKGVAPGSVQINAVWSDADRTAIDFNTETKFAIEASGQIFQLGYVLLEDGLNGDGDDWALQIYKDEWWANDPDFKDWTDMPEKIYNYKYNNVPVAAWEPYRGIEGSVPASVSAGQTYYYTYKGDISDNNHIQNKDNLTAVVFLVDKQFGNIINAAKCKIEPFGTDIRSIEYEKSWSGDVYDIHGRKVSSDTGSLDHLPHGIYIVRGKKVVK